MKTLIFATNNTNKVIEIRSLLDETFAIISLSEAGIHVDIPEPFNTLEENAIEKSEFIYKLKGVSCFAEDTGLEVDALDGEPGVKSARYAGEERSFEKNIDKLLETMIHIPEKERMAAFRCVLVYLAYPDDPAPLICQGTWQGVILTAPRGENGFGYDPIFFDREKNCSAAQLPIAIKNQISHRGKALRLLLENLAEKLQG